MSAQVAASTYDLVVTDYSHDGSAAGKLTTAKVATLRSGGARTALAYLSIGEAENYRYYWQPGWVPGSPAWLGPPNPDYPDNFKVRYWDPTWQASIFGSPDAYLDQIIAQGFDGVYLDVIDAFEYWGPDGNNERPSAAQDMVDFVKVLASYARAQRPGFLVFPQNGSELSVVDSSYIGTESDAPAFARARALRRHRRPLQPKRLLACRVYAAGEPLLCRAAV
jgi:cysteinyl-tRNA synthetase